MRKNSKTHVYVVDDDEAILSAVCAMITEAQHECTCFGDGESCLKQLEVQKCDLLITDVKMPGKDGIEVLKESMQMAPWLPVIVMTSYADVPMSVQALKTGAYDFIEKPFEVEDLMGVVQLALKQTESGGPLVGRPLTKTERIVLRLLMQGMSNRRIAYVLQRSDRTIEVHRGHIMQKLGVENVVELVKRATVMGYAN